MASRCTKLSVENLWYIDTYRSLSPAVGVQSQINARISNAGFKPLTDSFIWKISTIQSSTFISFVFDRLLICPGRFSRCNCSWVRLTNSCLDGCSIFLAFCQTKWFQGILCCCCCFVFFTSNSCRCSNTNRMFWLLVPLPITSLA